MQLLEPQLRRGILPPFAAVSVSPLQWDVAYSPWPAMLGERSFSGKADAYFSFLHTRVQPYLKAHYGCSDAREHTAFIGYSLAGVAALYAYFSHPFSGSVPASPALCGILHGFPICKKHINRHRPAKSIFR